MKIIKKFFSQEIFNFTGKLKDFSEFIETNVFNKFIKNGDNVYELGKIEKDDIVSVSEDFNNLFAKFRLRTSKGVSLFYILCYKQIFK